MKNKKFIAIVATAALLLTPTTAFAGETQIPEPTTSPGQMEVVGSYSIEETLKLLLAGTGPIAEKNPELVRFLGFAEDRPAIDEAALEEVIADFVKFDPKTTSSVQKLLESGQPLQVEKALSSLTSSFQKYLKEKSESRSNKRGIPIAEAAGCGAFKVCVGVTLLAVANGVVYANVAAATFAVATLAVTWVYLMDDPSLTTDFERDEFIAKMTRALNI